MAEICRNNSESFYEASRRTNTTRLDENGVNTIFKVMNQYDSSKELALITTKAKVAELLLRSTTENKPELAGNAITLAKKFADAEESVMLAEAKIADKNQERFADIFGAATDVIGKTGGKSMGVEGMTFEILVKGVAAEVKRGTKGSSVDTAQNILEKKDTNENAWKKIALLTSFEAAANEKVSSKTSTKEEKNKAENFLKNLQDFNEQLPDSEKILDTNGRLINAANASPDRLENFQNAVSGGVNSRMKDQVKARSAALNLQESMGKTADRMGIDPK